MEKRQGRPPKYTDPAEMALQIELYAAQCDAEGEPMTVVGMALFLGFCDTTSLLDYGAKDDEGFSSVIKKGKSMVEARALARAYKSNGAGAIFYLKNLGYSDKQQLTVDPITINITGKDADL